MKVLSFIKSHKIISLVVAVIIVGGTGGAIYATNQNKQEVNEVAKTQSAPKVTEAELVEETKPVESEKVVAPTAQTSSRPSTTESETTETPTEEDTTVDYGEVIAYVKKKTPVNENLLRSSTFTLYQYMDINNYKSIVDKLDAYFSENPRSQAIQGVNYIKSTL